MALSKGQILFFSTWTIVTGLIIASIVYEPEQEVIGEKVGAIEEVSGSVQIKPDAQILWREVNSGFLLGFNDQISTGKSSEAIINIENNAPLRLGPNTVITIQPPKMGEEDIVIDFQRGVIEKVKGSVKNRNRSISAKARRNISISTGKSTIKLGGRNSELTLAKTEINGEAEIFKAKGNIRIQKKGSTSTVKVNAIDRSSEIKKKLTKKLSGIEIDLPDFKPLKLKAKKRLEEENKLKELEDQKAKPKPLKKASPKKGPKNKKEEKDKETQVPMNLLQSYVPEIISPQRGWVAWVDAPIESVRKSSFPITVKPPMSQRPPGLSWQPFVTIPGAMNESNPLVQWLGQSAFRQQKIKVDLAQASQMIQLRQQPFPEASVMLASAALLSPAGTNKSDKTPQNQPFAFRVRSLRNIPSGGLRLQIADWDFSPFKAKLHWQKPFKKRAAIYVKKSADINRLRDLMKHGNFAIDRPGNLINGVGIFFVRQGELVATIRGQVGGLQNIETVRQKLGAQFAYKGPANAYIGGLSALKQEEANKTLPQKVYILNNGDFIGINTKFMNENPSIQAFLNSSGSSYFRTPIKPITGKMGH